ncbi:MAG: hypothetical protein FWE14_03500 [Lachnospiraceae bacterium]|nr:hypothetical protein [Lachnospiraceae bacterium]
MNKQSIIYTFKESLNANHHISKAIFGESSIPNDIESIELALSSLDFVDLIVDVEERLGFEISEICMFESKVKIGELIKIIHEAYQESDK